MKNEERAELAVQLKKNANCCQAVLGALADQAALDMESVRRLGSGFGAGMGNMEATCGALVGAVIAAGMHLEGQNATRYSRQISENFRSRCGSIRCCELKGRDTGRVLCPCEDCVRNAVRAYADVLGIVES